MRPVRYSAAMLALIVGGVLFAGLAPAAARQDETPKILRVWWSDLIADSFEPQTNEYGISDLTLLVYEGLTRLDEELNLVPAAAESWEFNDDGTVVTFHLRESLTYSDGTPLTAERFRYAIARRCDPHLTSWGAQFMFDIAGCQELNQSLGGSGGTPVSDEASYEQAKANLGVRAIDDRTLEIRLTHPAPYFPALTHWVGFIPVKQELIEANGDEWWRDPANWVGNGPFRLTGFAWEASPPRVTLAANDRYWGGRPALDGIEYQIMEIDEALAAYKAGELEITWPLLEDLAELEADPVLSRDIVRMPSPTINIFNFNLRVEPFTDKNVREAFAYAFDRDAYCREMLHGTCQPVLSWIPPQVPGAIETDAYAFDPTKAREALAASSYGGAENLPEIFWYYVADDEWNLRHAHWLHDQYQQVLGIDMTLTPVTWDELVAMQEEAATWPQIADTYWWSNPSDPHGWMRFWLCGAEGFAANVGYCNPEYDALVDRADRELDPEERIRLVQESQHLLVADAPAIFGYAGDQIGLVKPYVTGFTRGAPYQSWPGWATPLTVDIAPH
jgi:oligopeptide transport system substrate-binding protein